MVAARHTLLFHVLLLGHILGAMTLVAGVVFAGLVLIRARRAGSALEVATILGLAPIGVLLVVAGGTLVGVCGIALVGVGHFGFGTGWVDAAIVIYAMVLALGGLGGAIPKRARLLAKELGGGPVSPELRGLLWDRWSRIYNDAALVLLIVLVWLMVFKP